VLEVVVAGGDGFFQAAQRQIEVSRAAGLFFFRQLLAFRGLNSGGTQAVGAGGVVELVRLTIRGGLSNLPLLRGRLTRLVELPLLRQFRRAVVQQDRKLSGLFQNSLPVARDQLQSPGFGELPLKRLNE
jgi:hypothetical protein